MLLLKYLPLSAGVAMFLIAAGILTHDAYALVAGPRRRLPFDPEAGTPGVSPNVCRRTMVALVMLAWAPLLISAGLVVISTGTAGVGVSQSKGTLAGTLYHRCPITDTCQSTRATSDEQATIHHAL